MYSHTRDFRLRHYLKQQAQLGADSVELIIGAKTDLTQQPKTLQIFDTEKMKAMIKENGSKYNLHRNHQRFLTFLGDTNGFLTMSSISQKIDEKLDELQIDFPNFKDVIDYYREQIALSRLTSAAVFSANPLLISGPPGVGKTAFCRTLARLINTHFEFIGMSGITAGFVLGGMSSNWSDGKPGKIVEALARGHKANPLILLDEIDKAGGDSRYDSFGSLYQLLENETAQNFIDEGLEIPVNCAHIVWIATANQLKNIPDPILSRFALTEVTQPTRSQMITVLQSIYKKIRSEHAWGTLFHKQLSDSVIDKIICSNLEPRLIQRELISACGRAALAKLKTNDNNDNFYEISPDEFNPRKMGTREIKMGFLP